LAIADSYNAIDLTSITQGETPMPVRFTPEGYHTVTPYLIMKDAARALEFYKKNLSATELMRFDMPDGRLGHAEIKIGDSIIMLADEFPEMGHRGPKSLGGSPVGLAIYVPDVDKLAKQFVAAGAKEMRAVKDQFYGDRSGTFEDPFGHVWTIATHTEDVTPEELQRRFKAGAGGG
jgi:PhnB protein